MMTSINIDWVTALTVCTQGEGSQEVSTSKKPRGAKKCPVVCMYHQAVKDRKGQDIETITEYCSEIHPAKAKQFTKRVSQLHKRYILYPKKPLGHRHAAIVNSRDEDIYEKQQELKAFLSLMESWIQLFFVFTKPHYYLDKAKNCRNVGILEGLSWFLTNYLEWVTCLDLLEETELYSIMYHMNRTTIGERAKALLELQQSLWSRTLESAWLEQQNLTVVYQDAMLSIQDSFKTIDLIQETWSRKEMQIWNRIEQLCSSLIRSAANPPPQRPGTTKPPVMKATTGNKNGAICIQEIQSQIQRYNSTHNQIVFQTREIVQDLYQTIGNAIKDEFGYRVVCTTFGSRTSGLADSSSDLDIALSLYRIVSPEDWKAPTDKLNIKDRVTVLIDSKHKVTDGFINTLSGPCITTSTILNLIRREVRRSRFFGLTEYVAKARVPIIKLFHRRTNVEVDICVENQLGVQNTFILRDYMNLPASQTQHSKAIRDFLLSIKYWVKQRCCNQSPQGTLSTFSWCLMGIYSLLQAQLHGVVYAPRVTTSSYGKELIAWHKEKERMVSICPLAFIGPERKPLFEFLPITNGVGVNSHIDALLLLIRFFAFYGTDCSNKSFDFYNHTVSVTDDRDFVSIHIDQNEEVEDDDNEIGESESLQEDLELVDQKKGPASRKIDSKDEADMSDGEDDMSDLDDAPKDSTSSSVDAMLFRTPVGGAVDDLWRTKVTDVFDGRNLGKCIRSIRIQQFLQSELRRGIKLLLSKLHSNQNHNSIWSEVAERHPSFPNRVFAYCPSCDTLGHDISKCSTRTCNYCGWLGHDALKCQQLEYDKLHRSESKKQSGDAKSPSTAQIKTAKPPRTSAPVATQQIVASIETKATTANNSIVTEVTSSFSVLSIGTPPTTPPPPPVKAQTVVKPPLPPGLASKVTAVGVAPKPPKQQPKQKKNEASNVPKVAAAPSLTLPNEMNHFEVAKVPKQQVKATNPAVIKINQAAKKNMAESSAVPPSLTPPTEIDGAPAQSEKRQSKETKSKVIKKPLKDDSATNSAEANNVASDLATANPKQQKKKADKNQQIISANKTESSSQNKSDAIKGLIGLSITTVTEINNIEPNAASTISQPDTKKKKKKILGNLLDHGGKA